jgi:hypothetical protein
MSEDVVTDGAGEAISSTFTANEIVGEYIVEAAAPGVAVSAEFNLKNISPFSYETYDGNNVLSIPGDYLLCTQDEPNCTYGVDSHADAAHQYAHETAYFYLTHHDRDSIDDQGMTIISTVHHGFLYYNAYWDSALKQMVYGDGYGFPLADDVVAHELTHGVTDYTSNLFYYYQSGAINESFSDLWGEFVDLTNGAGDDSSGVRWLLGEDVAGLGAIRDMQSPTAFSDPDKMTSTYYDLDPYFEDNGGVHTNSGVNNKAVYLMVDGDTFNGYAVNGIGMDKVAAIYYLVQTSLLTSGSNYHFLYYAVQQACEMLIGGPEGITASDCVEVTKALDAVEMDHEPVAGFNPEASVCPAGLTPSVIFSDDFENGTGNWTGNSVAGYYWDIAGGYATSGLYDYWGPNADGAGALSTQFASAVSLPSTSSPLYLRFNHSYDFEWYLDGARYDGGILEYSVNGGAWTDANSLIVDGRDYNGTITAWNGSNPYESAAAFVGPSHGYVSSRYDLSAFNGSMINFRWVVATDDSTGYYGWDVDDVMVYQCVPPNSIWYLAEGYTGAGFGTFILIQNPNETEANVTLTYMLQGGGTVENQVVVPANSRYTVVAQDEGQVGPDQAFSTRLDSDQPIIVERAMYWPNGAGSTGGHVTTGVTSPRSTWYLAEGYTSAGFGTFILIQNPNENEANVTLTYMLQGGGMVERNVVVAANSRYTVVAQEEGQVGPDQAFSTRLDADQPIVVERAMYFNNDGHAAVGVDTPVSTWYLAEGYTGAGFGTFILIQNPNETSANVTLTYMLQGGGTVERNVAVAANSRYTALAHDAGQVGVDQAFSTRLDADQPIIVERAMYWPSGEGAVGGHGSPGVGGTANVWNLAEGYTGAGFGTFILIQNPNDSKVNVTLTYMLQGGGTVERNVVVAANSRYTVLAHDAGQVGLDQAFSTQLVSDQPIIVERAMYFNNGGHTTGGVAEIE